MADASKGEGGEGIASDARAASVRELLLGMGGSSMRKSYYPELRSKLDDLELFRELVDRSSDAILLFALPSNALIFGNAAARAAFGIVEGRESERRILDILPGAGTRGCFIHSGSGDMAGHRFEVVVNEEEVAGNPYAIAVARDETERILMEERIRKDLLEKEAMLREIHHRVKNNFQIMKSMLALEASTIEDETARLPLIESENRIMSMAGVHERLYESPDMASVEMKGYIEDIVSSLRSNFASLFPVADIEVSCAELALPVDLALPCGLIVNELVSNCIKHAFPAGYSGRGEAWRPAIRIEIAEEEAPREGWGRIAVSDNGVGLGEEASMGDATTVGFMLIRALVSQIKGQVAWRNEGGAIAILEFPLASSGAQGAIS